MSTPAVQLNPTNAQRVSDKRNYTTPTERKIYKHEKPSILDGLTSGLSTAATSSGGPGEVSDRHDEEAVAVVGQTGKGVVPGSEGGHETEETTSHEDRLVGGTGLVTLDVTDTEQQEGQVQEEEEGEEGNSGTESAEEQDSGKDEPSLFRISGVPSGSGEKVSGGECLPSSTDRTSCNTWFRRPPKSKWS